jgi:hypothetical protein
VSIHGVALAGSRLYLASAGLTSVSGQRRPNAAAVDARTGRLLPWKPADKPGWVAGAGVGDVDDVVVAGRAVFLWGHDGWGIVDRITGRPVPWASRLGGAATAFAIAGDRVYLGSGGRETIGSVAGRSANNLAAVNVGYGTFSTWLPNLAPVTAIQSIAANAHYVLVTGSFATSLAG